jgi:hypothetical protein
MPQLLFAMEEPGRSTETALKRARSLAQAARLDLIVLHVVPEGAPQPTTEVPARRVRGDFVAEVSRAAAGAALVVLPDGALGAHYAVVIAQRADVPVLVAREERPNSTVVAAVVEDSLAEVRQACRLAEWLSAPLVVLHHSAADGEAGASRLRAAAKECAPGADVVSAHAVDPLRAVLDAEAHYRCDVLVVCAAPLRSPGLAQSVVRCVRGSVLVTPR